MPDEGADYSDDPDQSGGEEQTPVSEGQQKKTILQL
jgi:hypothetical protein